MSEKSPVGLGRRCALLVTEPRRSDLSVRWGDRVETGEPPFWSPAEEANSLRNSFLSPRTADKTGLVFLSHTIMSGVRVGVLTAVDPFDEDRGVSISFYATLHDSSEHNKTKKERVHYYGAKQGWK